MCGMVGYQQCPAGRVFQYRVGSGIGQNTGYRVGFGSGRSVEIYDRVFPGISFTLGYFRVFRVFSGIFGYFRVFRVSTGIYGYQRVFTGILYIISFLVVVSKILRFDGSSGNLEGIYVNI